MLFLDLSRTQPLFVDSILPATSRFKNETVFEEEDSFQLLENITMPEPEPVQRRSRDVIFNQKVVSADETISNNPQMFDIFHLWVIVFYIY